MWPCGYHPCRKCWDPGCHLQHCNKWVNMNMKRKGPVRWSSRWRCLLPVLETWVPSLVSTWWKERCDSCKLSSDTHTPDTHSKEVIKCENSWSQKCSDSYNLLKPQSSLRLPGPVRIISVICSPVNFKAVVHIWKLKKKTTIITLELSVAAHTWNASTQEAEAGVLLQG